jgi:hypothetical protein
MDIRFGDHPSFHRAALGMVGGSAALGLALHLVKPGPSPTGALIAGLGGIAIGAAWGYGKPAWRIAAAALACVPLLAMTTTVTSLSISAAIMGVGVAAFGLRGMRGALAVMLGATATMLAMWGAHRVGAAKQTAEMSLLFRDVASAAAMGMMGVFAVLPRHLKVSLDPVTAALRRLPTNLDSEVRDLCTRSMTIWNNAKDKLADNDPGKNLVRDGVLKTLEVAAKSAEVSAQGATDAELTKRMGDLDTRIAAATDSEVKAQYVSARAALEDQKRYREHITQGRERMIARMHNHVAALEKFQLAAGGLAAARAATAGATAVKQLEELSADVAASGEALAELELGSEPAVATVSTGTATSVAAVSTDAATTATAPVPAAPSA